MLLDLDYEQNIHHIPITFELSKKISIFLEQMFRVEKVISH